MIERPATHIIAAQAGVASQTVSIRFAEVFGSLFFRNGIANGRLIGHFQTVGHMAGEAHIEDSRLYTAVLHDVYHLGYQWSCLPSESAAGLHNNLQPRITTVELLQRGNEQGNIIVLTRHEMAATKIYPFQLGEPLGEIIFYMLQRANEHLCPTLAMTMTMETVYIRRESAWQLISGNTETRAGRTRIIKVGFHLAIAGIHPQPQGKSSILRLGAHMKALILGKGIESEMGGIAAYLVYIAIGIRRRIGVCRTAELLCGKH